MPLDDHDGPIPIFASLTDADRYFLGRAHQERAFSDDPKAKHVEQSGVGAVIVRGANELSRSANVLPPALARTFEKNDRTIDADDRYHVIEHAERAAIFKGLLAGQDLQGSTIYCTRFPCSDCARAIVWAGIKRAVFPGGFMGEDKWIEAQRAALRILRDGGLKVRYLPLR